MAEVEEHGVLGVLLVEEVARGLVDAVREGGGDVLVHEAQAVQVDDGARAEHGAALLFVCA